MPISGFLAASSVGWPSIFYLFGALSILWSVSFFFLGADLPANHRSISEEEREYIEKSLRTTETKGDGEVEQVKKSSMSIKRHDRVPRNKNDDVSTRKRHRELKRAEIFGSYGITPEPD